MPATPDDGPARTRVLVVDDHPMVAAGLVAVVTEEADLTVVGRSRDLAGMRAIVATQPVDVVLLDVQLPDGDGIAGTRQVKQLSPATQVVILTAHASDGMLLDAIDAGCAGFLTKDAAIDEVVAAIRAAARGEILVAPSLLGRLLPRLRQQGAPSGRRGSGLTAREREVLALIAEGRTNADIAARLDVSVHTVRNHVQSLLGKLDVHSKLEALAVAMHEGLLP